MNRDVNACVRLAVDAFAPAGPVLEIGSLYLAGWEAIADLRPLFPGRSYVGCDIRVGLGVDRIEDAQALSFADGTFGTVVMCEVLAHIRDERRAIAEARRVLRGDGLLVVSTAFDYRLNGFPTDYRRLTASGLDVLLESFPARCVLAIGPRVLPTLVFAVAAKQDGAAFDRARSTFEESVAAWSRASRVGRHLGVMTEAGRRLLGCALGRARLGVEVFDPRRGGGYLAEAARRDDANGPSRATVARRPLEH